MNVKTPKSTNVTVRLSVQTTTARTVVSVLVATLEMVLPATVRNCIFLILCVQKANSLGCLRKKMKGSSQLDFQDIYPTRRVNLGKLQKNRVE